MSCISQLIPDDFTGFSFNSEDRFVPDLVNTAGELSPLSQSPLYLGTKRGRNDSGCYLSGGEDDLFSSFGTPDSKRHCSTQLSPVFPESPLAFEHAGITIPVTGTSPVNTVEYVQPTANCSTYNLLSSTQSFTAHPATNTANIDQLLEFQSMQQCSSTAAANNPFSKEYQLVITEQPEEYYRARYQTEGVRAPIKGRKENFPAVRLIGPECNYGKIVVKLVHEDETDHTSCSLDCSEERKNALVKKIGPHNQMATEFEDLRIRREKKKEGRKATASEKLAPKDGHNDKIACLLFEAEIKTADQQIVRCRVKSDPISLTAAPEPAELDWLQPTRGHVSGQDVVVIKGSKMTSPKVTFRIYRDGQHHDLHGVVDKERSHQNVLLVKTPPLNTSPYHVGIHQSIRAEVIVTTGRSQLESNPLQFDYIPDHVCRECMQTTNAAYQYPTGAVSIYPPGSAPHDQSSPTPVPQSPVQDLDQTSLSKEVGSMLPPPSQVAASYGSCITETGASSDKPDDFMSSLINLFDYPGSSTSASNPQTTQPQSQGMGSPYMLRSNTPFTPVENQLQQPSPPPYTLPESSVSSPLYLSESAVNSPSPDKPLYSPVTPPQQSPQPGVWNHIEQMLLSLKQANRISQDQYMMFHAHCMSYNTSLYNAYINSQKNEEMFLQMLAYFKPDLYQPTH